MPGLDEGAGRFWQTCGINEPRWAGANNRPACSLLETCGAHLNNLPDLADHMAEGELIKKLTSGALAARQLADTVNLQDIQAGEWQPDWKGRCFWALHVLSEQPRPALSFLHGRFDQKGCLTFGFSWIMSLDAGDAACWFPWRHGKKGGKGEHPRLFLFHFQGI